MSKFVDFTLDDLILHEKVLQDYTFLSAQILNRWLRAGLIRRFKGKDGLICYPKPDLSAALEWEMNKSINQRE